MINISKYAMTLSAGLIMSGLYTAIPLNMFLSADQQPMVSTVTTETPIPVSQAKGRDNNIGYAEGTPVSITVASLGINASVEKGYYDQSTGLWTITEESAFYATPTKLINSDNGNTFIYGHNSHKIFGKLLKIQDGAEVSVITDNGYVFTYVYQSTEAVQPSDVHALEYSGKPRLTLQTCSGLWNETRQMFYFDLKDYRKL